MQHMRIQGSGNVCVVGLDVELAEYLYILLSL